MRIGHMVLWDIKFQARYGFYLLYGSLTVLYIILLNCLPQAMRANASAILIFSDPAAMGLFFMGAIILLEKSQRMNLAFSVSPVSALQYVISKVVSLSLIALLVAGVLAVAAGREDLHMVLLGTALSSVVFTLIGLIIGTKIVSLNQFVIGTVPFEIIIFVPAILHMFGITPDVMRVYPPNVCMDLITGKTFSWIGLGFTMALLACLLLIACRCVLHMWRVEGGVKL